MSTNETKIESRIKFASVSRYMKDLGVPQLTGEDMSFLAQEGFEEDPEGIWRFQHRQSDWELNIGVNSRGYMHLRYCPHPNSPLIGADYSFTAGTFHEVYDTLVEHIGLVEVGDPRFEVYSTRGSDR